MTITQQYHRKPEPVEAVKLSAENADAVATWCGGEVVRLEKASDPTDVSTAVRFPTLTGPMGMAVDDYLVKNEKGAFSRVSSANFEKEYDVVEIEDDYLPTA